eukprot:GGOE01045179.1.p1 GENE.GGOE01045179.1~~GGOE01045179.1.p1  ORF type:complete len:317 (-),score=79.22 GGOE01045179.1:146-1096(-)
MHFQQINVTHCRGQLLPIDVPLHPQSIPPSLQPFRRLLRSWAGLRVLLAGDSLARQFFLAVHCTAHLLGATVNTTLPPLRLRERNLTDGFAASVGVALDGLSACFIRFVGFSRFRLDAGDEGAIDLDGLCYLAASYDRVYLNPGWAAYTGDHGQFRRRVELLAERLKALPQKESVVLLEHPPQHFSTSATGDYPGFMPDNTTCRCTALAGESRVARNNRILREEASRAGLPAALFFEAMTPLCGMHFPKDCTHYRLSPTVWAPVAAAVLQPRLPDPTVPSLGVMPVLVHLLSVALTFAFCLLRRHWRGRPLRGPPG